MSTVFVNIVVLHKNEMFIVLMVLYKTFRIPKAFRKVN